MAAGGDKIISYDPPGAIGLVDNDAVLLVRFDETDTTTRPKDETGALTELDVVGSGLNTIVPLVMPQLIDGAVGRARQFLPTNRNGLAAKDVVPGSTLVTRDVSIQVILSWNAAQQLAAGAPGTIIARGLSTSAVEFVSYGLQIAVVDAPSFTAQLQWFWQDIGGTIHVETGAQFVNNGNITMLTATRRWVSPTSVLLRYYIGDQLIGTVQTADGSIGGGTTGTTLIGHRFTAPVGYPATAANTKTAAANFGTWSAGWLCEDLNTQLAAAYGGTNLPETAGGGSPVYQVSGPLGDKAVRVTVANTGWSAASTAFLDPTAAMDIGGIFVVRTALPLSVTTTIASKTDFAGGPGWQLSISNAGVVTFNIDHTTPGNVTATANVSELLTSNEWFVVMFGLDRIAGTMRVAVQSLVTGVQSVGASVAIGSLGSVSNAGASFRLHRGGGLGNTLDFAAVYMGVSVGAATGLPANLSSALTAFCTYIQGTASQFLAGSVDELLVVDRELCPEEIEATWLRITKYQPLGVQLFRETINKGFPIPNEPDSDPQLEIRMVGQVLGYAAARAEEFRANFLPQRAYGQVLADWIEATRVTPQPADDIDTKRSRVLSRLRQKQGIAPPGIQAALAGLLGGAPSSALQLISLSNVLRDEFTALDTLRWDMTPTGAATLVGNAARFAPAAGTYLAAPAGAWRTMVTPISQSTLANVVGQERILGKVQMVTPQSNAEVGVMIANRGADRYLLLGLRDNAGTFQIVTEVFDRWVSSGAIVRATLGGNPASLWLYLHQQSDGTWIAEWSTTSETTGYTASAPFTAFGTQPVFSAGAYFRSTAATAGTTVCDVDMLSLYAPNGTRTFNAFVLLDRALGFKPDVAACRSVLREIRHGFTFATFITSKNCLANDPDCGAGVAPCGPFP